jgi:phthalate 4,5-cis-dihydrodiol dehydrogenase
MTPHKLRLGVAGLGKAFSLMVPTFLHHPLLAVTAGADPRAEARKRFAEDFSAKAFATVQELCAEPSVDAVYISTPHQLHLEHARLAAEAGKHILVEKPMALSLAECRAMIDAARKAKVALVVGHSHSFDAPICRTREIIASGKVGRLRMITALNFTDFLYRPRRPEELDTEKGGGVLFNQAPHHIDVVRLIGGGRVTSVRCFAGAWDRARPTEGAYSATLTFADGVHASLTYSGYAHFDSDEFCEWVAENGRPKDPKRYGATRRSLGEARAELDLKGAQNYGGAAYKAMGLDEGARLNPHFGLLIASCERADLRPTPRGVMIYGDDAPVLDPVPPPRVPRDEVVTEFYDAAIHGKPPVHGGEWGLATMEACFAMLASAREGREIALAHQTEVSP